MRHEKQVRWVARAGWVAALLLVAALASSALGPPSILDDTDGDGMPDVVELVRGTDPADPDSDADGAFDGDEASRIRSHTRLEEKPFGEPGISRPVDLDGDGDIDILQLRTSFSPDELSWYENRLAEPAGDFARREIEELSVSSSRAVVAADLDGDGDPELVVWFDDAVDDVWYYENRLDEPSADFARREPIAESLTGGPPDAENPFSAADVDGDGDLDLLISSDQLEWYENRLDEAAGDFADPEVFGVRDEHGFDYGMVDAVDFDADGDPDALSFFSAYTEEGSVFWYENLRPAEAGFSGRNPIASALPGIESVSAADLDGDGDFDLLIAIPSDGSGWVENVGDATAPAFGPFVPLPIQWVYEGQTLAAELDGDGNPDILQGGVWYPNPATDPLDPDSDGDGLPDGVETGSGTFIDEGDTGTDPKTPDTDGDGLTDGVETNSGVVAGPDDTGTDPLAADTDGDGLPDPYEIDYGFDPFATDDGILDPDLDGLDNLGERARGTDPRLPDTDFDGLLDLSETGTGLWVDAADTGSDPRDPDSDDDGLVDGVETASGVFVDASDTGTDPMRPDSDGDGLRDGFEVEYGFDPNQPGEAAGDPDEDGLDNRGEQTAGTSPLLADTDGDGLTDWQEVGRIHNRPVVSQLERFAIGYDDCDAMSAADIDGDGDPDIFCGSIDGYVSWWENGADAADDAHLISDWFTDSVATADFDGDGDPDLVAAGIGTPSTGAGRVWWQENQREGGAVEFGPEQVIDDWRGSLFAADVDGDGDPDIVQGASYEILWYENRLDLGSHDFAPGVAISRPGEGEEVTAIFPADLDADGDADLLAASHVDRSIYWYETLASPTGPTFPPRRLVGSHPGRVFHVLAADLDSDGDPDVVWSPDGILWYSNVPSGLGVGFVSQGIVIEDASGPAVADLDRDGHLDLLAYVSGQGTHWWRNRLPITFVDKGLLTDSLVSVFADMDGDGDEDLVTSPPGSARGLDWLRNPGLDPNDPDTDGDGLLDGVETETGVYEGPADTGTDPHEADSDGDGLPDGVETATGVFGGPLDTGSDPHDADTDGDGLLDGFEVGSGLDLFVPDATGDPDGDFVDNTAEQAAGTRANDPDTDGDGLRDGFEIRAGFDPLVPGEASLDPDGDGVVNLDEQRLGSDPNVVDTDVDGLPDGVETATGVYLGPLDTGTYPTRFDSDDDGLRDGFENRSGLFEAPYATGSDPHLPDSDGDGLEDGFEVQGGMDPTTPGEAGLDPDGDTLSNLDEQARGTDPLDPDSDGDGLLDPVETLTGIYVGPSDTGTDPRSVDSDGDRLRDGFEVVYGFDPNAPDDASLDPDADGLSHLGEQRAGADPFRADTDGDGESDGQEVTRIRSVPPIEHSLGFACEWVDLADLDGDSDADVLCAAEGSLTWHANRLAEPSGDIAPGALIATPAPASPRVASADLDGDGDMDVVSNFAGEVVWFENRLDEPAGSIGPERRIALGADPTDLAFDDRDADGDIDVLIRSLPGFSPGRVDWHPNRLHESEGDFGAAEVVSTLTRGPLLLSDLDHDADRDLVSRTQPLSATEGVWFETLRFHTGTFSSPGQVLPGADSSVFAVAVGDFDGDEADDVVWGGGLAASWNRNLSGPSAIAFSGPTPLASSAQLRRVATEDLDSDGDADVFAQLSMEGIVWWQNAEAGPERFPDPSAPLSPRTGALGLLAADLDGDGDPDIVAWFPDEVVWLENPGTSAVPEPGASALGVAALWVLARLRRSKRPLSWAHE